MEYYFENFKKFIQDLLSDKLKILSFSFGIIPWINDWEEIVQGYFAHLLKICLAFGVLFTGLVAHYIFIKKRVSQPESKPINELSVDANSEPSNKIGKIEYPQSLPEVIKKENISSRIFWRFLSISFFSFLIFTVSSFIFLRYAPVYYVKIGYYNTEIQSNNKAKKINKLFENYPEYNLRAMTKIRSSHKQSLNYLLCINGGFISEKEANSVKEIAEKIIPKANITIGGSSNIPLIRKIQYLRGHVKRVISKKNKDVFSK